MTLEKIYRERMAEQRLRTQEFLEQRCIPQAVANLPRRRLMRNASELHNLVDTLKPAVIVAAGPSLDDALPLLKRLRRHLVLYCVDAAFPVATREGLEPDVVVNLDPEGFILRESLTWKQNLSHRSVLLAPTFVHGEIMNAWRGKVYCFNCIDPNTPAYCTIARLFSEYHGFMSKPNVGQFSVNVAFMMRHPALAWAGLDHAAAPDRFYAGGVLLEDVAASPANRELLLVNQDLEPVRTSGSFVLQVESFIYHYRRFYKERPCFNLSNGILPFKRDFEGFEAFVTARASSPHC